MPVNALRDSACTIVCHNCWIKQETEHMTKDNSDRTVMIVADPEWKRQVALGRGFDLAKRLGGRARVVAFCYESLAAIASLDEKLADRAKAGVIQRRKDALEAQIKKVKLPGLKITSEVVWSKRIHEWIEEACRAHPPEVVVKTGHRSETFVYTPTDWHLIRDCAAPALIVSEKSGARPSRCLRRSIFPRGHEPSSS